jgi:hypothetical protein
MSKGTEDGENKNDHPVLSLCDAPAGLLGAQEQVGDTDCTGPKGSVRPPLDWRLVEIPTDRLTE